MMASFLITLREGLEAALIVGIVLSVLRKLDQTDKNRLVWWGVGAAVLVAQRFSWWEYHFVLLFPPLGLLASFGMDRLLGLRPLSRQPAIVAAGLADRCEIQVSYAIGVAEPTSISVETFGTGRIADDKIVEIDGQAATSVPQLRNRIAMVKPGTEVKLVILRDGKRKDISLTDTELLAFLESGHTLQVASIDADGYPHLAPMWYVVRDGKIVFR